MAESIIALLVIVAGGVVWWFKRQAERKDAIEPAERDKEIDRAFASDNPADRAAELQSLDDRLRRVEAETGDNPPRQ